MTSCSCQRVCLASGSRFHAVALLAVCLLFAFGPPAAAETQAPTRPPIDGTSNEARDAFLNQGIKSLSEIMAIARARVAGEFLKIELKRKKHGWEYKVRILTPQGRRSELKINAVSGEVIEIE